jgi:hypothetical protein
MPLNKNLCSTYSQQRQVHSTEMLRTSCGVQFWSPPTCDYVRVYLCAIFLQGFDPVFGARPVKRALQRELQTLLAQALLRGEFIEGDTILVEAAPDGSCLTLRKGSSSSTRSQLQQKLQLTDRRPPASAAAAAAAAANGDSAFAEAAARGGAPVPPGKKKVIRLVKKKSISGQQQAANGAVNGSANGSPANGKSANGQSMSRSSSSGGLQSVPLPLGADATYDSDAE